MRILPIQANRSGVVDYFFVGVGSVDKTVDRRRLWTDKSLAAYRQFYDVLVRYERGELVRHEQFHPYHDDWRARLAPYIIFDRNPGVTHFNLKTPLLVSTFDGVTPDAWRRTPLVRRLENCLFRDRGVEHRRLRTASRGYGHAKLNLDRPIPPQGLSRLREELLDIARAMN